MSLAEEKHYTVKEIAETWSVCEDTIIAIFRDQPGVLKISRGALNTRRKRKHVTLRIPASVLARVHSERSA